MPARLFMFAAVAGFLAVVFGAFAAHGLERILDEEALAVFRTAVQYHFLHALALFGTALLSLHHPGGRLPKLAAYSFLLGILLFSGSLYLLSVTGMGWLGAVTPLGGLCFLAGWGCLIRFAMSAEIQPKASIGASPELDSASAPHRQSKGPRD